MSNPDLLELAIREGAAKALRARAEAAAARAEDCRTKIGLKTGGALVISTAESALEERNARDWRALADEIGSGLGKSKMIRVTFDLLPGGDADRARTIGIMEIANIGIHGDGTADYAVALKKTPPFAGALRAAWKKGKVSSDDTALNAVMAGEDDELITALATGHHRTRRGVYDLLFRALRSCGLDKRNS